MSYDFDHPEPQGLSSGAKTAIGCGAVAFFCMVLLCGGIVWVGYLAVHKAEEVVQQVIEEIEKQTEAFAVRFEEQGYQRVEGQVIEVTTDVEDPTVYTGQVFRLEADSSADLAVMAQVAEINGTIDGDLHFLGQALTIHPDAVITGDVHVQFAQAVDNQGTIEGEVLEDDRLDIDLPGPMMPPEVKPPPGDVVDTADDVIDTAEDAGEEPAPEENPAPAAEDTPAPEVEAEDPPAAGESEPAPDPSESPEEAESAP